MTEYTKEDDYTLLATSRVPGANGTLCRYFNFAAEQVTTIFNAKAEMKDSKSEGYSNPAVAVSVSVALTSQMQIQKFSDLDSNSEVEMMRTKLVELGGKPPASGDLGKGKKMHSTTPGLGKG